MTIEPKIPSPGNNRAVAIAALDEATAMLKQAELHLEAAQKFTGDAKGEAWLLEMMRHAGAMAAASAFFDFAGRLCPEARPPK